MCTKEQNNSDTDKKEITVTHHIVYSTKGGCGKTAFSLFLTMCNVFGREKDGVFVPMSNHGYKGDHYFIDLDLLGSSLEYYLRLNKNGEILSSPTLQHIMCGDKRICDVQNINQGENLKSKIAFSGCFFDDKQPQSTEGGLNDNIFIIPIGASEKEKAMFHVKKGTTPLLRYEELEAQLGEIQQSILTNKTINGKTGNIHFVYDLAPNADSYTDAVLDEIFERLRKNKTPKDGEKKVIKEEVVIYLISNSPEMLICNIDWLNRWMCGDKKHSCAVVLVSNDSVGEFGKNGADYYNAESAIEIACNSCTCSKSIIKMFKAHLFLKEKSIPMALFRVEGKNKQSFNVSCTKVISDDKQEKQVKFDNTEDNSLKEDDLSEKDKSLYNSLKLPTYTFESDFNK